MKVVPVRRAYEEIAFDSEPGSPVYRIDYTDTAIGEKLDMFRRAAERYRTLEAELQDALSSGDMSGYADLADKVAELYREIITTMLGEQAYMDVVGYVRGGEDIPVRELSVSLTGLVRYLVVRMAEIVAENDEDAVRRYLGDGDDVI